MLNEKGHFLRKSYPREFFAYSVPRQLQEKERSAEPILNEKGFGNERLGIPYRKTIRDGSVCGNFLNPYKPVNERLGSLKGFQLKKSAGCIHPLAKVAFGCILQGTCCREEREPLFDQTTQRAVAPWKKRGKRPRIPPRGNQHQESIFMLPI